MTTTQTPILDGLIAAGHITVDEDQSLIGHASDGEDLSIGSTRTKQYRGYAEAYLTDHPTPDTW